MSSISPLYSLKKERVKRVVDGAKLFTVSNGVRFFESASPQKLRVVLFRVHYDALPGEGREEEKEGDENKGGQTKKRKNRG